MHVNLTVRQLQAEQEEAEKRLETVRKEINTQRLEVVKVEAKTAIMEKYCHSVGFTPEQTDRIFIFQLLEYSGNLYSEEHKRSLSVMGVTAHR